MSRDVAEYLPSIDFSREDIDRMNFPAEQARKAAKAWHLLVMINHAQSVNGFRRKIQAKKKHSRDVAVD